MKVFKKITSSMQFLTLLTLLASNCMLVKASEQASKRGKTETGIAQQDAQEELTEAKQDATSNQDSSDYDDSEKFSMSYVLGYKEEDFAEFDDPKNKIYVTKEQIANCGYKQASIRNFSTNQQGQNSSNNQ